jgi:CRP/FNR family transcriptional regulator
MAKQSNRKNCDKCTGTWENFRHLTKGQLEMVNANRYEAAFKPGEIMIKQGTPASNAMFISSGIAKSYIEGMNGKNFVLDLEKPGGLIMEPGAYVSSRSNYSVAAVTPVHACFVSSDILKQLARINGAFAESLLEDFCRKTMKYHVRMVSMAQKSKACKYFGKGMNQYSCHNLLLQFSSPFSKNR